MRGACPLSTLPVMGYLSFRKSISAVDVLLQADKAYCSLTKKAHRRSIDSLSTFSHSRAYTVMRDNGTGLDFGLHFPLCRSEKHFYRKRKIKGNFALRRRYDEIMILPS